MYIQLNITQTLLNTFSRRMASNKRSRLHVNERNRIQLEDERWCWLVGKQNGTLMHHSIVDRSFSILNFMFVKVKNSPTLFIISQRATDG